MSDTITLKLPYPIKKGSSTFTSQEYPWDSSVFNTINVDMPSRIRKRKRAKKSQEKRKHKG